MKSNIKSLSDLEINDIVIRTMGQVKMEMKIVAIENNMIYAEPWDGTNFLFKGGWKFSINNGNEIDEEIGRTEKRSGTFIVPK